MFGRERTELLREALEASNPEADVERDEIVQMRQLVDDLELRIRRQMADLMLEEPGSEAAAAVTSRIVNAKRPPKIPGIVGRPVGTDPGPLHPGVAQHIADTLVEAASDRLGDRPRHQCGLGRKLLHPGEGALDPLRDVESVDDRRRYPEARPSTTSRSRMISPASRAQRSSSLSRPCR